MIMKRTFALLLSAIMLLSLIACKQTEPTPVETTPSTAATTQPTEEVSSTPETTATLPEETEPSVTVAIHTHSWKKATCTAPKTCTVCGTTEGGAAGHSYKDATCTAPKTCTVCGTTEGGAAGHSYKDATCTAPKTCTVCGTTEGSAAGHSYKDATCTAPKTCTVCGVTAGDALGHNYKDATCTTAETCTVCGVTAGDAAGHTYRNATCTTPKTCAVCGTTSGNALGHNWRDATCTTVQTCTDCGNTSGSALGHNYVYGNCTRCQQPQENYHALTSGTWRALSNSKEGIGVPHDAFDTVYYEYFFDRGVYNVLFGWNINNFSPERKAFALEQYYQGNTDYINVDGIIFQADFGGLNYISYTENGNTISVSVNHDHNASLTLERIAGDQLKVVDGQGFLSGLNGVTLKWSAYSWYQGG